MANLRDGSSGYPTEVDSFVSVIGRPKSGKNELTEDDYNGLANAVVNLQTELGTDPAGSKSTVGARFNVHINSDGTLKNEIRIVGGNSLTTIQNAIDDLPI